MRRGLKAIEIIEEIVKTIDDLPLTDTDVVKDIATMRFKIRSLSGNFAAPSMFHRNILRSLWKIGKIDEIVSKSFDKLATTEKEKLINYLDSLEDLEPFLGETTDGTSKEIFALEVFRDAAADRSIN